MYGMTALDYIVTLGLIGAVFGLWYLVRFQHQQPAHHWDKAWTREHDAQQVLGVVSVILVIVAGVALVVNWGANAVESTGCRNTAEKMDREWQYDVWTGCMIQTDTGEFVPDGKLRFNETGEQVEDE